MSKISDCFGDRLSKMFVLETKISIRGLAIGVELDEEDRADEMMSACLERGLVLATQESTLLLPALTIERTAAAKRLDILLTAGSTMGRSSGRETLAR